MSLTGSVAPLATPASQHGLHFSNDLALFFYAPEFSPAALHSSDAPILSPFPIEGNRCSVDVPATLPLFCKVSQLETELVGEVSRCCFILLFL